MKISKSVWQNSLFRLSTSRTIKKIYSPLLYVTIVLSSFYTWIGSNFEISVIGAKVPVFGTNAKFRWMLSNIYVPSKHFSEN